MIEPTPEQLAVLMLETVWDLQGCVAREIRTCYGCRDARDLRTITKLENRL